MGGGGESVRENGKWHRNKESWVQFTQGRSERDDRFKTIPALSYRKAL